MFQQIVDAISGSSWSYAIVFGVAAVDAFFPLVPSEATVITAGVLAGSGDLRITLVILAAATGALCGDNVSYWAGRIFGERIAERVFTGSRRVHYDRAHRLVEERGAYIILVARFIPLGRTAVTFACGSLDWPWHRFIRYDAIAASIWASYAALLGYFGGKTFQDAPWKGLVAAFALALLVTGTIELVRHLRKRRTQSE